MQSDKIYNKIRSTRYLVLPLCAILFFSGCSDDKTKKVEEKEKFCLDQNLKKDVQLATVSILPIEETITLTGEIESNSDKTVPYVSLVDGVVNATYFSMGDYVRKGQVLAEVKSSSLNEMQDDTQSLQAQLAVAKRKLASVKSMYKDDIASQKDLVEAQADVSVIESNIAKTRKNMQLYSANKNTFQIKAPTDGYVIAKNISQGMPVTAGGEQLFTISNLDKVWVMANVYATNMRHVYANQSVVVKTLAYPDESFPGKVNQISQVFNEEERVLKAKIILENVGMKLKPGMSADILFPINAQDKKALAVPYKALIFDNNQNYVVVYKNDCLLEIRPVTEVASNSTYSYVEGGLKEGEKVVISNALLIYDALKGKTK